MGAAITFSRSRPEQPGAVDRSMLGPRGSAVLFQVACGAERLSLLPPERSISLLHITGVECMAGNAGHPAVLIKRHVRGNGHGGGNIHGMRGAGRSCMAGMTAGADRCCIGSEQPFLARKGRPDMAVEAGQGTPSVMDGRCRPGGAYENKHDEQRLHIIPSRTTRQDHAASPPSRQGKALPHQESIMWQEKQSSLPRSLITRRFSIVE